MGPGEEVILHCGPIHDVTTLIVEILYPLSVSGTIVIPPCDTLYNYAKTFKIMKQIHPTLIWGSSKFYEKRKMMVLIVEFQGNDKPLCETTL